MIDLKNIKNIILDLGRVILKINLDNTIIAFKEFGFSQLDELDIVFARYPFFMQFELGLISAEQFISDIRKTTGNNLSHESILKAWNSMIGEYFEGAVPLIQQLDKKYRMFLLSNTNEIHEKEYNNRLKNDYGIANLSDIFEKVYYSHTLHLSKPDPLIFEYVLNDNHLVAEETLFIDDILVHIESAAKLGIRTFHLEDPLKLTDVLT
jgi:HAD superfamily hydrolase (TIGR01509 family)